MWSGSTVKYYPAKLFQDDQIVVKHVGTYPMLVENSQVQDVTPSFCYPLQEILA